MEHAIGAEQGLIPGGWAEEPILLDQGYGLCDQLIEALEGDLDALIGIHDDLLAFDLRILAEGREKVAEAPFRGEYTRLEAKALGIIGVAGIR